MNENVYEQILRPVVFPKMYTVRQKFNEDHILNVSEAVSREVLNFPGIEKITNKKVALAVGSRGIAQLPVIVKTVIETLKRFTCHIYIVPAMGSHGGAVSENQTMILKHLGVSEETMGVPVKSSMDTDIIGFTEDQIPVYFDHMANQGDYTITIARIKPHCSFRGKYESGMVKMNVIGLGKQRGADYCHSRGMKNMGENLEKIGRVHMEKSNLLFCLGLMENAYDQICMVRAVAREKIMEEEPGLLEKAKTYLPGIPFGDIDLLAVDEIGKNITGTGMDCNVIQRFTSEHMKAVPFIKRLTVLDLTEESDGNASGAGLADISTRRLFEKMSWEKTYPNSLTARTTVGCKIPMIMENDFDALRAGIKTVPDIKEGRERIVRIKNTLRLDEFQVSQAIAEEIMAGEEGAGKEGGKSGQLKIINKEGFFWEFDQTGALITGWEDENGKNSVV